MIDLPITSFISIGESKDYFSITVSECRQIVNIICRKGDGKIHTYTFTIPEFLDVMFHAFSPPKETKSSDKILEEHRHSIPVTIHPTPDLNITSFDHCVRIEAGIPGTNRICIRDMSKDEFQKAILQILIPILNTGERQSSDVLDRKRPPISDYS